MWLHFAVQLSCSRRSREWKDAVLVSQQQFRRLSSYPIQLSKLQEFASTELSRVDELERQLLAAQHELERIHSDRTALEVRLAELGTRIQKAETAPPTQAAGSSAVASIWLSTCVGLLFFLTFSWVSVRFGS